MTRANDIQHGGDHYKGAKFQHWDICAKNRIGYLESCASKYTSRWPKKGGAEDLRKAIHYCDKIVEVIDEFGYRPSGSAPDEDLRLFFEDNKITDPDERSAIVFLLTWRHESDILNARKRLIYLLARVEGSAQPA